MSQQSSKFWVFALPVSLFILVAAYYIKIPSARHFIDAHTSLGHQLFGSFVRDAVIVETDAKPEQPVDAPLAMGTPPILASTAKPPAERTPAAPTPPPVFDLQVLERDPAHWPKKVVLKKAVTFPAVVDGKVVGTVIAPIGAEANLKAIKDGKVGLEYEGGGAWLPAGDTDLASRAPAR
jgi:hypothetical protein